jgi:hypothetical protein
VIEYLALNPCTSLIRAIASLRVLPRLRAKMVSFQRFHSLGEICRGLESMMSVVVGARILKSRMFLIYFAGHLIRLVLKKNWAGTSKRGLLAAHLKYARLLTFTTGVESASPGQPNTASPPNLTKPDARQCCVTRFCRINRG